MTTYRQFFAVVLEQLGAPSEDALEALATIVHEEGQNSYFNPLNIEWHPGDNPALKGTHAFNSVGVQAYADVNHGITATIAILQQPHWASVLHKLRNGTFTGIVAGLEVAYTWAKFNPGSQAQARALLDAVMPGTPIAPSPPSPSQPAPAEEPDMDTTDQINWAPDGSQHTTVGDALGNTSYETQVMSNTLTKILAVLEHAYGPAPVTPAAAAAAPHLELVQAPAEQPASEPAPTPETSPSDVPPGTATADVAPATPPADGEGTAAVSGSTEGLLPAAAVAPVTPEIPAVTPVTDTPIEASSAAPTSPAESSDGGTPSAAPEAPSTAEATPIFDAAEDFAKRIARHLHDQSQP